jgi:hypothetical protein
VLGINSLITVSKYWQRWSDPRFVVAVLNNCDLNMVSWELRGLGASPKLPETRDVPDFDYAGYCELLGFTGIRMDVRPTSCLVSSRHWPRSARCDAVGFVGREFECANPREDDRDGDAHQRDADPIGMCDPGKRQTKIADHEFSSGVGLISAAAAMRRTRGWNRRWPRQH